MSNTFSASLSGLSANQQKLSVIGNNLANLNTVGFKASNVNFADLVSQSVGGSSANPMQIAPGEVFTALERGTIDGYGWPSIGVFDLGWQEQTKTRVDPGFYQVETGVYFSLAAWNKLNAEQKAVFEKAILAMEDSSSRFERDADAERKRQGEAGIETYNLPEASAAKFLQTAQEAGWAQVLKVSPQDGAALQKLFTK